jgi:C-terminal processing protease CtpA/Prc
VLNNLGELYRLQNRFEEARKDYEEALQIVRELAQNLGPSDLESFETNMQISLIGIGAELRSDDGYEDFLHIPAKRFKYAKVQRLLPGGPAQLSGKINVGDRICAVSQGQEPFVDTLEIWNSTRWSR